MAAPTIDAVSSAATAVDAATLSWSHTCSGSNRYLTVSLSVHITTSITGVTYGAQSMTLISAVNGPAATRTEMWGLLAPATGSNTVAVTASAVDDIAGSAISYNGADQTTPIGTPVTANANNAAPTLNVTAGTDELVQDALSVAAARTATVGAGQTQRTNVASTSGAGDVRNGTSTEPGPGTITMSWSLDASGNWALIGVAIKPVTASAASKTLGALGVG